MKYNKIVVFFKLNGNKERIYKKPIKPYAQLPIEYK